MKQNIKIYFLYLLLIVLLLPLAYGHEEGAQVVSKESLEGPLYALIIIALAIIIARFIKKSDINDINQGVKGGKKYGRKK